MWNCDKIINLKIYLYILLGIFILNGKLSTRKVESSSDSPPHVQKQIVLVFSLDGLREYKDILVALWHHCCMTMMFHAYPLLWRFVALLCLRDHIDSKFTSLSCHGLVICTQFLSNFYCTLGRKHLTRKKIGGTVKNKITNIMILF